MPVQLIEETLRAWRDAERLLDELPPMTPDHDAVRLAVIRLREIYARVATMNGAADSELSECRAALDEARATVRSIEQRGRGTTVGSGATTGAVASAAGDVAGEAPPDQAGAG